MTQQECVDRVRRIYAEMKWKMTTSPQTCETLLAGLDKAIERCKNEIPDKEMLAMTVRAFETMKSITRKRFTSANGEADVGPPSA